MNLLTYDSMLGWQGPQAAMGSSYSFWGGAGKGAETPKSTRSRAPKPDAWGPVITLTVVERNSFKMLPAQTWEDLLAPSGQG